MKIREYLYLVEANTRLRSECMRRLVDIYGETIPEDKISRVLAELRVVQEKNDSEIILYLAMFCSRLEVGKGEILVRGDVCSLYIAYLLGITSVNPMDINMDIFPEYMNDKCHKLIINISIPEVYRPKVHSIVEGLEGVEQVVEMSDFISDGVGESEMKLKRFLLLPHNYDFEKNTGGKIEDGKLIVTDVPVKLHRDLIVVNLIFKRSISMLNELVQKSGVRLTDISYTEYDNCLLFNIYDANFIDKSTAGELEGWLDIPEIRARKAYSFKPLIKINSFNNLVRAIGLMYGSGVWTHNARLRLRDGDSLDDVITCREDIYDFLINKGLAFEEAQEIVCFIENWSTRDLVLKKNYEMWKSYEKMLMEHNVNGICIESLRSIKTVMRKGQLLPASTAIWQLGYFKRCYPDIYKNVYRMYMN